MFVTEYSLVGIYWHHIQPSSKQVACFLLFAWIFDLKIEAVRASETSAKFLVTTQHHITRHSTTEHVGCSLAPCRQSRGSR